MDPTAADAQLQEGDGLSEVSEEPTLPPLLQTNDEAWTDFPWPKFPGYTKTTRPVRVAPSAVQASDDVLGPGLGRAPKLAT